MADWKIFEERFPFLIDSLKNAKRADKLGHSFLVVSSNPEYRLQFPVFLAMLSACASPKPDGSFCGSCNSCRQLSQGIYPDCYLLVPTSKSRQIPIGVDDDDPDTLRNFQKNFYLGSSTLSGWKIGIIQDADTMNDSAQNAFLKTLEEPPEKCLFILTTGRYRSLLPTICSRCQLLNLTDNRCSYDLTPFPTLTTTLKKLVCDSANNLVATEDCARELIRILESLEELAAKNISEKWEPKLQQAQQLESQGIKLLEKRRDAEISCEYLRLREQYISILHAVCAQLALLAGKMDVKVLPNPELVTPFIENMGTTVPLKERDALNILSHAEKLTTTLRSNVNDALAIRSFALSIAIKKSTAKK